MLQGTPLRRARPRRRIVIERAQQVAETNVGRHSAKPVLKPGPIYRQRFDNTRARRLVPSEGLRTRNNTENGSPACSPYSYR